MSWAALLAALASIAALLAALGQARTHKPRRTVREASRVVAPDTRKAAAHPPAAHPLAAALLPAARRAGGVLRRAIARFLVSLPCPLAADPPPTMVASSEPNLPIAAHDMPAASAMVAKVQRDCPVEIQEDPATALREAKAAREDAPEVEPEQPEDGAKDQTALKGVFFDGLQFYKILTSVGRTAVQSAVDAAVARVAAKRPLPQSARPDSIALIRERYPDFICLLPTATHPAVGPTRQAHSDSFPPRMDLLSALLLSSSSSSSTLSATSGSSKALRTPVKGPKEDAERAGSEQVRLAAALASPKRDGGFLRVA